MFIYLNSRKPASTIHYNTSKGKALLPQEQLIPVFRDYEIFKSHVQNKKFFIFSVHAVYNLDFQSCRSVFFPHIKEAWNTKPSVDLVFVLDAARKIMAFGPLLGGVIF